MDYTEVKKLIADAKSISLIPSEHEPESLSVSLALFYTLKELGKNVNLLIETFPKELNFLVPSMDFLSSPKNFVISIPHSVAAISQIYYEKTDEYLKIHLTTDGSQLKKEDVSFYFQEPKPDLIITIGIQDFKKQLEHTLDSFGFLLGTAIVNIDNHEDNSRFGQINLIDEKSLSETVFDLINSFNESLLTKNTATCLLSGIIIHYENFKHRQTTEDAFRVSAELMRRGADHQQISENINQQKQKEADLLSEVMHAMQTDGLSSVAILKPAHLKAFSESDVALAVQKIKNLGIQNNLLVLWESHASDPVVKGLFYSPYPHLVSRVAEHFQGRREEDWVFLLSPEKNPLMVKEKILTLL